MALHRAQVGAPDAPTRVCVLDALAGHTPHARIDRWPRERPWDTTQVTHAPHDPLDVYCDAPLLRAVADEVQQFRAQRATHAHWWTARDKIELAPLPEVDLAHAVADVEQGGTDTKRSTPSHALVHQLITNASPAPRWLRGTTCAYELPPRTACLLTDLLPPTSAPRALPVGMTEVHRFVEQVGGVDVLLLDPPWPNQSAARAHRGTHHDVRATRHAYETLPDLYDIWRLRPTLEPLLVHRPLVAVWITNHPKVHRFVRDKLLPQLGLRYLGAWAWLKLAQDGASLYTLAHPRRRRPYELLVLAAHEARDVPPQVIASVALAHSQKPYVVDLLLHAAGQSSDTAVVVELFARHTPRAPGAHGWHVSVGNEALRFNACAGPV
ncbi:hypothetical protein GLX27_000154 [Malassezia furfur]|uniref:Methyltransferase-like protein 4 n=1 Tax=Malassezia furfur TaxID=55194 RepID=A0ABY8EKX1_MALFU|nr:hypothetical protein GLX27_000154 [Malassezia furfur]